MQRLLPVDTTDKVSSLTHMYMHAVVAKKRLPFRVLFV